ncbi:MAG: hypothetical protein ACRDYA_21705 [Egibacteraceae bacterium]
MISDATLARGTPCTTGARTIIDCAMEMTVDELRFLLVDARQRRLAARSHRLGPADPRSAGTRRRGAQAPRLR